MNFLDKNGLNHLWTKIKASFGTAIVESSQNSNIPFVTNHQIVNVNRSGNINVYDWFQKASKGGILEVVFAGGQGGYTYCTNKDNISFMYKMQGSQHGPMLGKIDLLKTSDTTYARLIKMDADTLVVAEFVQNK
nr:MAG: hypothetical protein [Bacteriophage sp.]